MAQFSKKERMIASFLSSSPILKRIIKKIYTIISYCFNRKGYKYKLYSIKTNSEINLINPNLHGDETFFGYYDKSPENDEGLIIFNETKVHTSKLPTKNIPIEINIINPISKERISVGKTYSYNWQQGARAQWISNHRLIYNYFENGEYQSAVFDVKTRKIIKTFDRPLQDAYKDEFFISINYERIMRLRPDYGYRNRPLISDEEMENLEYDGIWKTKFADGSSKLIVSLQSIVNCSSRSDFNKAHHKINHVMISPKGDKMIFIHRWYIGHQRFDRLMISDFSKLKVIADDKMVSHMCWIDNDTLFGYLRYNGRDGFYFFDIESGAYKDCETLNSLGNGDGHPSCHGDWIVIDTYPDKSRMQHLYLYNKVSNQLYDLLEVFQGLKYQGESRCDLHPRFSPDGKRVYFDTVYQGIRNLAWIDISQLL